MADILKRERGGRVGVMLLDSSDGVEVTFEALIRKCKSVSHGRGAEKRGICYGVI